MIKQINSIVISEKILLQKAIFNEERLSKGENKYSIYHSYLCKWYKNIDAYLNDIVGYIENNQYDFVNYIINLDFTKDQMEDLIQLRYSPLFKKALGEAALRELYDFEEELNVEFNNKADKLYYDGRNVIPLKTAEELETEAQVASDTLYSLYEKNIISEYDWKKYQKDIFYAYEYYVSISQGEQLFAPKLTNKEYKEMRQKEQVQKIPFNDQLMKIIKDNREELQNIQNLREKEYKKSKIQ